MKLKNIRHIGRYKLENGKEVNVKKGRKKGYGVDVLFYLYRNKRMLIDCKEFENAIKIED